MEHVSNSNLNNDNVNMSNETTVIVIGNPNRKKSVPNIKILYKDPKYEGLRKGIIEAVIMSGVVCD